MNAGAGQASFYWLSIVVPQPPARANYNSLLSTSESALVTSVLGSQAPDPSRALIVSGAVDCQFRDVAGAQFRVVTAATGVPVATGTTAGAPRSFYLQNNLPGSAAYTSNLGRAVWAMVNAPVDVAQTYMIQFFGRMSESQLVPVMLDQYPVETYAGAVSVLRGAKLNAVPPN